MPVTGIDQVDFIVRDASEADRYLLDWGLSLVEDECGTRYECADGSCVTFQADPTFDAAAATFQNLDRLIWGVTDQAALDALGRSVREARDGVDDPALSGLLDEIETRAAVELAKRERRAST